MLQWFDQNHSVPKWATRTEHQRLYSLALILYIISHYLFVCIIEIFLSEMQTSSAKRNKIHQCSLVLLNLSVIDLLFSNSSPTSPEDACLGGAIVTRIQCSTTATTSYATHPSPSPPKLPLLELILTMNWFLKF